MKSDVGIMVRQKYVGPDICVRGSVSTYGWGRLCASKPSKFLRHLRHAFGTKAVPNVRQHHCLLRPNFSKIRQT